MKVYQIRKLAGLIVLLMVGTFIVRPSAEIPHVYSVEDFFRNPDFTGFVISPDGKHLASLAPFNGRQNLFVTNLESGESRRLTNNSSDDVVSITWGNNERIIFDTLKEGDLVGATYAMDIDGRRTRTLVPPLRPGQFVFRYTWILDILEDDPQHILVTNNSRRIDYPDVYRLNIYRDDSKRLVERNPGNITRWVTDTKGQVRLAVASDLAERRTGVLYRQNPSDDWEVLDTFGEGREFWRPIAFDFDQELIYVRSNLNRDTSAVFRYDLNERKIGSMLYGNDTYDAAGLIISEFHRSPIGIRYHAEKQRSVWFDEEKQMIQQMLDRQFPDTVNIISSSDKEERNMVITSYSDRHPRFYHLFQITDDGVRLVPLGNSLGNINPEHMAPMKPIQFESRDGLTIHGYITLPLNWSEGNPVPMIVNPHGGPWARDNWEFNRSVQFLANRGYAVLQINFRSSEGYGHKFLQAGNKEWGTTMQYDIMDSVEWAIEQGYADRERIGIYGASYGGYTTMMQLVMYPEVYRFGINNVGPVELRRLILARENEEETLNFYSRTIGHPTNDRELLEAHSPLYQVENIQAPVFVIHGARDFQVRMEQADMLIRELRRHNKEHITMIKMEEGHGFRRESNVIEMYQAIEQFIAENF